MSNKPNIAIKLPTLVIPLFPILLILKLTETVDWSWWIITAPLWLPPALMLVMLGTFLSVALLVAVLRSR